MSSIGQVLLGEVLISKGRIVSVEEVPRGGVFQPTFGLRVVTAKGLFMCLEFR